MDKKGHAEDDQQGNHREALNRGKSEGGAEQDEKQGDKLTHRREQVPPSRAGLTKREHDERWPIG